MTPVRKTPPASLPVTLDEIKAQLFISFADYDDSLNMYLAAATDHLDGFTGILGRCMVQQVWTMPATAWQPAVPLPFSDVSTVIVSYLDTDGNSQTVDADSYSLVKTSTGSQVLFNSKFAPPPVNQFAAEPISFDMVCGYGDPAEVPSALKLAIMQLAAHWYENRAAVSDLTLSETPLAVDRLIAPYRKVFM